jgi:serine phosphatase RsbU (regulator of sigma subunit)
MLPEGTPEVPGYELVAYLESCNEVGGDLYDFHVREDGKLVFVVGDVTGKGMGAALLMSSFLASARVLYDAYADPAELSRRLGAMVHRTADPTRFVTGFVGCLDPATGGLSYVNAGHPWPMLVKDGTLRELESNGVPFGVVPQFPYSAASAELAPGEVFALFTDGIPEAQRGDELYNEDRLRDAMREESGASDLATLRDRLLARLDEFLSGTPRNDDITLVLIRRAAGA